MDKKQMLEKLTNKMREVRKKNPLTAIEQALFYELTAIGLETDVNGFFMISSKELCNRLKISNLNLVKARFNLNKVELIVFIPGKVESYCICLN